jgi:proteasome accessory factor C
VLDVPVDLPPEAEPVDVDAGLFRPSPDDVLVELELSAEGRWVAEYYPCESVSDLPDGRLRVVLRTPDTGWVRRLALKLGEDGRVIAPPELVVEIRDAATAALANYVVLSAVTPPSGSGQPPLRGCRVDSGREDVSGVKEERR